MIVNETIFSILILILGILYSFLMGLPVSIAYFYQAVFKKRAFPSIFLISAILFAVSFFIFHNDFFSDTGSAFFAAGGILLAAASLRLHAVMTGSD